MVNREKRREKVVRTATPTKGWVKVSATLIVVAMFLVGLASGFYSK